MNQAGVEWIAEARRGRAERLTMSLLSTFAALLPAAIPAGDSPRLFRAPEIIALPEETLGLAVADFDGDGRGDAAVTHIASGRVSVLAGGDDPPLHLTGTYDAELSPIHVIAGDLDGSGLPDLFVVNSGSSTATVLLNRGDGTFRAGAEVRLGVEPRDADLADLNGDGRLDAVASNLMSQDFVVLIGDGKGGLRSAGSVRVGDNPHSLDVADFDGDGAPDVAVIHSDVGGALSLFAGNGDGTFDAAVRTVTPADTADPRMLASGDFDEDGALDVAVLTDAGEMLLLRNQGGGGFEPRIIDRSTGIGVGRQDAPFVLVADLDGDGHLDVIGKTSTAGELGIRIFRGDGTASFARTVDATVDRSMAYMRLFDPDRDGVLDAVLTRFEPEVAVVRGLAPGDLDLLQTLPVPNARPVDIEQLDVDADGDQDLIVLSPRGLHVFTKGAAGYEGPVSHELPGLMQDFVAGDFDGEGRMGVAATDLLSSSVLVQSFGDGGLPGDAVTFAVFESPSRLAAADFDGDGRTDIALTYLAGSRATVALAPADPELRRLIHIDAGQGQTAVHAADFDGDGRLDLAFSSSRGLQIFVTEAGGGFRAAGSWPDLAGAAAIASGDLDGDGKLDLAVAAAGSLVKVFDPARTAAVSVLDLGVELSDLRLFDIDRDLHLDAALVSQAARRLIIERGGTMQVESYGVGSGVRGLLFADIDLDGAADAVMAESDARRLSILRGRRASAAETLRRGDVDEDGRVGLTDAVVLLVHLFQGGERLECADAADADDSGTLDLTDAIAILAYLFQSGAAPAAPGPGSCGADPTADLLPACNARCTDR